LLNDSSSCLAEKNIYITNLAKTPESECPKTAAGEEERRWGRRVRGDGVEAPAATAMYSAAAADAEHATQERADQTRTHKGRAPPFFPSNAKRGNY